jgi:Peptidase S24-like
VFLDISTELLRRGVSVRFRPKGFSMYPTIRDGEAVTVEPLKAHEARCGDILLYRRERGVIAHRVVRLAGEEDESKVLILRGDSLATCDAPVRAEQVLGRVISVERKGRKINLTGRRAGIRRAVRACAACLKRELSSRLGFLRLNEKRGVEVVGR